MNISSTAGITGSRQFDSIIDSLTYVHLYKCISWMQLYKQTGIDCAIFQRYLLMNFLLLVPYLNTISKKYGWRWWQTKSSHLISAYNCCHSIEWVHAYNFVAIKISNWTKYIPGGLCSKYSSEILTKTMLWLCKECCCIASFHHQPSLCYSMDY